jgi:alpha-amylase
MTNVFQQLQQRFRTLGKELTPQVLEAAQNSLQTWLEENYDKLAAKKASAEFNGTMMQWFHWYIPPDGNHCERTSRCRIYSALVATCL